MSIVEECKGSHVRRKPEAIASLLDGNGDPQGAARAGKGHAQALIDLARYQHQVLPEIAETIDSSRDLLNCSAETIRTKCGFVLRAAAKAGLLS